MIPAHETLILCKTGGNIFLARNKGHQGLRNRRGQFSTLAVNAGLEIRINVMYPNRRFRYSVNQFCTTLASILAIWLKKREKMVYMYFGINGINVFSSERRFLVMNMKVFE